MLNSFKQNIKKGFVTPVVLISMTTLFIFLAYTVNNIYGIYKNMYKVEDSNKDENLEILQGYLRGLIDGKEDLTKEKIINIFSNENINLKFKEFKLLFDKKSNCFVKKGVEKEVLILDFNFDNKSKRFIFIPIMKGEFRNDC